MVSPWSGATSYIWINSSTLYLMMLLKFIHILNIDTHFSFALSNNVTQIMDAIC